MNKQLTVAVLFGGQSPEYSVSLHSASSSLRHMPEEFHIVKIGITKEGHWYYYEGSIDDLEHDQWLSNGPVTRCTLSLDPSDHGFLLLKDGRSEVLPVDVVFPIMHGAHGEDGTVQGACALAGIPCVGCGMLSSALCMDKEYTHIVAEHAGVPMASWISMRKSERPSKEEAVRLVKEKIGLPCIVKPCNAGSSYGVTKVTDYDHLAEALDDAFQYDDKLLMESFVQGFEVGCAVLGNEKLAFGEPDEIELGKGIFDFGAKYQLIDCQIHVPARVSKETRQEILDVARRMYRAMDCQGMARVDCFVVEGHVLLNEINTIPGFTGTSRYPSMMAAAGRDFTSILRQVVHCALKEEIDQ